MTDPTQLRDQAAADRIAVRPRHHAPTLTGQQIRDILHPHRDHDPAIRDLHDTGAITPDTVPALGTLHDLLDGQPEGDQVYDVLGYVIAVGVRPAAAEWR